MTGHVFFKYKMTQAPYIDVWIFHSSKITESQIITKLRFLRDGRDNLSTEGGT